MCSFHRRPLSSRRRVGTVHPFTRNITATARLFTIVRLTSCRWGKTWICDEIRIRTRSVNRNHWSRRNHLRLESAADARECFLFSSGRLDGEDALEDDSTGPSPAASIGIGMVVSNLTSLAYLRMFEKNELLIECTHYPLYLVLYIIAVRFPALLNYALLNLQRHLDTMRILVVQLPQPISTRWRSTVHHISLYWGGILVDDLRTTRPKVYAQSQREAGKPTDEATLLEATQQMHG